MNNPSEALRKILTSKKNIRIKLLGDSVTHGLGGVGFEQDGEAIVEGYARNPNGYCWANLFRDALESRYACKVVNNACTGTAIEFILDRFDELVDPEDDIVICTIGTNNRHLFRNTGITRTRREHMEQFYQNILKLNEKFQKIGVDVIFNANIPAAASNEQDTADYWRLFHMNDVHDLYMKASGVCGFPMISFYTAMTDYCTIKGIPVDNLLIDTLHPNDEGHKVMFHLLLRELGLAEKIS